MYKAKVQEEIVSPIERGECGVNGCLGAVNFESYPPPLNNCTITLISSSAHHTTTTSFHGEIFTVRCLSVAS